MPSNGFFKYDLDEKKKILSSIEEKSSLLRWFDDLALRGFFHHAGKEWDKGHHQECAGGSGIYL